jgi:hypothetical protein
VQKNLPRLADRVTLPGEMHKVYFFKKRKIMTKAKRKGRKEGRKENEWLLVSLLLRLQTGY